MKRVVQRQVSFVILFTYSCTLAFAQSSRTGSSSLNNYYDIGNAPSGQTQYSFKPVDERNLIPIRVIGEVGKPGVHYVPRNANLIDLLSLAGGPTSRAEISGITIRSVRSGTEEMIAIDGKKLFGRSKNLIAAPKLFPNDVVYIPIDQPLISDDTARLVTVLGAIASALLSVVIVQRELRGK
ncbi:hypothetical protein GW915_06155 [bacterium]|nr:hypothetical protein [bacterium]